LRCATNRRADSRVVVSAGVSDRSARRRPLFNLTVAASILLGATVATAQQLSFTPFNSSGIYRIGERAGWTIAPSGGATVPDGNYTYTIRKNNLEVLQTATLDLSSGKSEIEITLHEPAMLYVQIDAAEAAASPFALGAAVAPTELRPSVPRPADFDAFWDSKLRALGVISMNAALTPIPTDIPVVHLEAVKVAMRMTIANRRDNIILFGSRT